MYVTGVTYVTWCVRDVMFVTYVGGIIGVSGENMWYDESAVQCAWCERYERRKWCDVDVLRCDSMWCDVMWCDVMTCDVMRWYACCDVNDGCGRGRAMRWDVGFNQLVESVNSVYCIWQYISKCLQLIDTVLMPLRDDFAIEMYPPNTIESLHNPENTIFIKFWILRTHHDEKSKQRSSPGFLTNASNRFQNPPKNWLNQIEHQFH